MPNNSTLVGLTFGRWKVLRYAFTDNSDKRRWECACVCGQRRFVTTSNLRNGKSKSCGCLGNELAVARETTHGDTGSKTHRIWGSMIQRCHNPKSKGYKNYGKRGITVCQRWRTYTNFLIDMGPSPMGLELERIDNNKGYSVDNCCWATRKEQSRNKRNNHWLTLGTKTLCIKDWAELLAISKATIYRRLAKNLPIEKVLIKRELL